METKHIMRHYKKKNFECVRLIDMTHKINLITWTNLEQVVAS